jgi:hypothetical protein
MNATTSSVTTEVADRAAEAVALVAERLAEPAKVAAVASRDGNRDPVFGTVMWAPLTLSNGLPGVAAFHAELARTDPGRWPAARDSAHRHLAAAAGAVSFGSTRGLFAGPAALLAAAQACAGPDGHYRTLRRRLADWLADDQLSRIEVWRQRREHGPVGTSWEAYDVINGLTGTGRLLLDAVHDPAERSSRVEDALTATFTHLTAVTDRLTVDGRSVPGWWVPPDGQPSSRDAGEYPRGDFNLGMAHGVPGPLWLLSTALAAGYEVPGQRAAIGRMAGWIIGWTLVDEAGAYWPCRVGWDEETGARPASAFSRTAWCYGAPGVAASLYRAGEVCGEAAWCDAAVRALRAALLRDESRWALDGPTVCHGYAGLLLALHRVGVAAADRELLAGADRVAAMVLHHADPDAPFVFRHLMRYPHGHGGPVHRALDVAGLLEGAAGVACALLPLVACPPVSGPAWHRCLGMS